MKQGDCRLSSPCMNCKAEDPGWKIHDRVRRCVRFIKKDSTVHQVVITILRWMCSHCKKTTRHYPPFLEPHKRFATTTIADILEKILEIPSKRYREAVQTDGRNKNPIRYSYKDNALSHTSCWRWVYWVAKLLSYKLSHHPKVASAQTIQICNIPMGIFQSSQARTPARLEVLCSARIAVIAHKILSQNFPQLRNSMF